ncbi:methyltransferase [Nocardia sp. NPDC004278]
MQLANSGRSRPDASRVRSRQERAPTLLCDILHDWDVEHAHRILARCVEAARPTGRVLVIEPAGGRRASTDQEAQHKSGLMPRARRIRCGSWQPRRDRRRPSVRGSAARIRRKW